MHTGGVRLFLDRCSRRKPGSRRRWVSASYVLAGLFLLGYALIRWWSGRHGSRGPDAAWFWGHLLFLVSQVMVATVLVDLLRRLRGLHPRLPGLVTGVSVLALVGKYAAITQTIIDIVVGLCARDRDVMGAMFTRVQAAPGGEFRCVSGAPLRVLPRVLIQVFTLCSSGAGRLRWWPAALLTVSLVAAVDLDLLPLSAVLLQISFLGLYRSDTGIRPAGGGGGAEIGAGPRYRGRRRCNPPETMTSPEGNTPSLGSTPVGGATVSPDVCAVIGLQPRQSRNC